LDKNNLRPGSLGAIISDQSGAGMETFFLQFLVEIIFISKIICRKASVLVVLQFIPKICHKKKVDVILKISDKNNW